jgi:hypothetical protein
MEKILALISILRGFDKLVAHLSSTTQTVALKWFPDYVQP